MKLYTSVVGIVKFGSRMCTSIKMAAFIQQLCTCDNGQVLTWIHSWISVGWCLLPNAAARDGVGTHCRLAKSGWIWHETTMTVFSAVFSAIRHCIRLKLSHVTSIVSFFIILPINKHYFDKKQCMTPLFSLVIYYYTYSFLFF